jgi:hypothetical protein
VPIRVGVGSYIVASDNFRTRAGLVAAAALLADYVLTVSVSIAAGVAALTSIFILVGMMWAIRSHYRRMGSAIRPETPLDPAQVAPRLVVPVARLDLPARQALAFAQAIGHRQPITAVHVTDDLAAAARLRDELKGSPYGDSGFVVIESEYRALAGPLLGYLTRYTSATLRRPSWWSCQSTSCPTGGSTYCTTKPHSGSKRRYCSIRASWW